MPITPTRTASPAHPVATPAPASQREHRQFKLTVPSGQEGMALSTINGLAGVALPDVSIRAGRSVIMGMNTEIDIVAQGTREELEQLKGLISSSVDTRLRDEGPSNRDAARRLLALDAPGQPRPVPENMELSAMELRLRVLTGHYVEAPLTTWVESRPDPLD